jgi:murein DD-endopeptidase MepM/ murein hydrolase activator NlpD
VNARSQWSLQILRGNGARVARFRVPGRVLAVAAAGTVLGILLLAAVLGDWWWLRGRIRDTEFFYRQLSNQRLAIQTFYRRVADLRREVATWRELHARIREPFDSDVSAERGTGIGGGMPTPFERPASRVAASELDRLAASVAEEGERLRALEQIVARASRAIAALPSRWPVHGAVNSEFGDRASPWTRGSEFHSGIDIGAERGTPVRAPSPGTVAFAGSHAAYGRAVMLDHGYDLKTLYGHLSKISVAPGQRVERGGEIGLTGNTGRSSGPHLHYEVLVRGQPVNPRSFLWD